VAWEAVEYLQGTSVGCKHKHADLALLVDDGLILYIPRSNSETTEYYY
jgi:hypothetical protein